MFEPFLGEAEGELDEETLELFDPTIDAVHKNLRPKISLVGFSGVGKTTITRLIKAEDIPMEHVPTISGDIGTIKIGKLHFNLWDFAGQEQFSFLWNKFIDGSDAVLLITDSTIENVDKSRYFTELQETQAPYSQMAVIGNKQDLPEAISPADIERILKKKTYSMIATDPANRAKMIQIIADVLEISDDMSELLKPLKERDEKLKEAEIALSEGDLNKAACLFEELSDLSYELGDDRLSQEYLNKAHKIQDKLECGDSSAEILGPPVNQGSNPPISQPKVVTQPSFMQGSSSVTPPPQPNSVVTPPQPNQHTPPIQEESKELGSTDQLKKDLRVQMVKVNKTLLELETKNILGELDDEAYAEKCKKLESVKARIQQQIDDLS